MAISDDEAWLDEPTQEATEAAMNGTTPEAASADAPAAAARAASSGAAKTGPDHRCGPPEVNGRVDGLVYHLRTEG